MKSMMSYDLMESLRITNQWLGASAKAMYSFPAFGLSTNPFIAMTAAAPRAASAVFSSSLSAQSASAAVISGLDAVP